MSFKATGKEPHFVNSTVRPSRGYSVSWDIGRCGGISRRPKVTARGWQAKIRPSSSNPPKEEKLTRMFAERPRERAVAEERLERSGGWLPWASSGASELPRRAATATPPPLRTTAARERGRLPVS